MRTDLSVGTQLPPLAGFGLPRGDSDDEPQVREMMPTLQQAFAASELSPLTAIGATLPPVSLMNQIVTPADSALQSVGAGTPSETAGEAAGGTGGDETEEVELTAEEQG